jgi:hypothetical protein
VMHVEGIKVVHAVPGRIRLKVAQVRENPALANQIQNRLTAIHGIYKVEVNPLTGSVLLLYDAQTATASDSLRALAEPLAALFPGFDSQQFEAWQSASINGIGSAPALTGSLSSFFSALDAGIHRVTGGGADLKVLVPLALFLFGLRGLLVSDKLVSPTWYDFFWFSLGTYFMLNPRPGEGPQ